MAHTQRGNVLFLILIAVALFAALSYAVSNANRGGSGDVSSDKVKPGVASLLSYTAGLRSAVQRISMRNGIPGDQVLYNNNAYTANNGANAWSLGTPANPAVYVFHPNGGAQSPVTFENISEPCKGAICLGDPWTFRWGHIRFVNINVPDVGTSAADVVALLHSPSQAACAEINRVLGYNKILNLHVQYSDYQGSSSVNTPPVLQAIQRPDADLIRGQHEFCYYNVHSDGNNDSYQSHFFASVLWPR